MTKCANPECSREVNGSESHIRLKELTFCDYNCFNIWLEQTKRFEEVMDNFRKFPKPRRSSG